MGRSGEDRWVGVTFAVFIRVAPSMALAKSHEVSLDMYAAQPLGGSCLLS